MEVGSAAAGVKLAAISNKLRIKRTFRDLRGTNLLFLIGKKVMEIDYFSFAHTLLKCHTLKVSDQNWK